MCCEDENEQRKCKMYTNTRAALCFYIEHFLFIFSTHKFWKQTKCHIITNNVVLLKFIKFSLEFILLGKNVLIKYDNPFMVGSLYKVF